MFRINFFFSFILASFFISCSHKNNNGQNQNPDPSKLKQSLVNANKIVVHNESERINTYIKKHHWEMQTTGTGLRYMIYKNGEGLHAKPGSIISLNYAVEQLDSVACYSSKDTGPLEFAVNQSDQIRGLHELALLLKKGDKVKAILPPHLAYGLAGDNNKIPPRAVLVYDIEVLNVK
jgi:FKBP-type peptidyl-prolyl cis-trans isomerase FkpA